MHEIKLHLFYYKIDITYTYRPNCIENCFNIALMSQMLDYLLTIFNILRLFIKNV